MKRRAYISQHPDPFGLTRGTEVGRSFSRAWQGTGREEIHLERPKTRLEPGKIVSKDTGAVRRIEEPKPKPRELSPEEEFSALWRGVDDAAYAGGYDIKPYSKELETELRRRQQEEGLTAAGLKDSGQAMVLAREFSRQEREMQAEIERIKFEKAIQGHNLRFLTDAEKRNLEHVARANLGLPAEETELIKKEDSEIKMEEIPILEPSQSSGQKEGLRRAATRVAYDEFKGRQAALGRRSYQAADLAQKRSLEYQKEQARVEEINALIRDIRELQNKIAQANKPEYRWQQDRPDKVEQADLDLLRKKLEDLDKYSLEGRDGKAVKRLMDYCLSYKYDRTVRPRFEYLTIFEALNRVNPYTKGSKKTEDAYLFSEKLEHPRYNQARHNYKNKLPREVGVHTLRPDFSKREEAAEKIRKEKARRAAKLGARAEQAEQEQSPEQLSDQGWVEEVGKYLRVNGRTEEFSGFEPYALRAVRYLRDQGIDLNRLSAERQMVYMEKGIPNLMRSWMRTE